MEKFLSRIQQNLDHWFTPDNLKTCLGCMDLTTLNTTDTEERVASFARKVNGFREKFPQYPCPAAICVYSNWGKTVKENLVDDGVKVAVVAGGFPNSQTFLDVKVLECRMAVEQGADEVDIVLPLNAFMAGDMERAAMEVSTIKEAIGDRLLKVILETGALGGPENIARASHLAMEAGADFIKTSTGKQEPAATPVAAAVMCNAIKEYYEKTGRKVGFKPAGGISTAKDAVVYLAIVESILGREWLVPELFRIGASRLANSLLSELEQSKTVYY